MPVSTDPDRSSATNTNGTRPRPARPPAHRESGSLRAGLHLRRRPLSRIRARLAALSGVPDQHGDLHHRLPAPVPMRAEGQPPLLEPHGRGSRPAAGPAWKVMQRTCQCVEQCLAGRHVPLCPPWRSPVHAAQDLCSNLVSMRLEPQPPALQAVGAAMDRNQEPQPPSTECA